METLQVRPMEWASALDIDEVAPFSKKDEACFRELRNVLRKHDALDRFGVTLIHRHFAINDDEAMVEYTDPDTRTLTIRPVKISEIDESQVTVTNWQLCDGQEVAMRVCVCARTANGHTGGHATV